MNKIMHVQIITDLEALVEKDTLKIVMLYKRNSNRLNKLKDESIFGVCKVCKGNYYLADTVIYCPNCEKVVEI